MNRSLYLLFPLLALLTGCQSLNPSSNFNSPQSKPPVGTIVQLNQTLTFQPGYSRSFVQNGRTQNFNGIDQLKPWCQFYRNEPPAALQTLRSVRPDRFIIMASSQSIELASDHPVMFASSALAQSSMLDIAPSPRTLSTIMKIKSEIQPEIVELKCAVFDDPFMDNFVSVNQINQTLGKVVTLILN